MLRIFLNNLDKRFIDAKHQKTVLVMYCSGRGKSFNEKTFPISYVFSSWTR